jgi:hypothetical protein
VTIERGVTDWYLVGGVVVWLAAHAHLSCLNLRQWITIGVDIHSFIHDGLVWVVSVVMADTSTCNCNLTPTSPQ